MGHLKLFKVIDSPYKVKEMCLFAHLKGVFIFSMHVMVSLLGYIYAI